MSAPRREGFTASEREAIDAIVDRAVEARRRFEDELDKLVRDMAQSPQRRQQRRDEAGEPPQPEGRA